MSAEGYDYKSRKAGEVAIFHHGKLAKMITGKDATALAKKLEKADKAEVQDLLAQAAGHANAERPGVGSTGTGQHLHGDSSGHAHKEFRRKTG